MLTDEQFSNLEKNEITFKLSSNDKFVNVYSKNKFAGFIFSTNTTVYFVAKNLFHRQAKKSLIF